eukprot:1146314-Pelagomonas_calceolata.AAC.4
MHARGAPDWSRWSALGESMIERKGNYTGKGSSPYKGYKGKRPQTRRSTASLRLFINTHEIMKEKRKASRGRREDVEKISCAQKMRHTFDGESRPGDWNICSDDQHMFFILYVIRITGITDWRSTIGPKQPVQLEGVNHHCLGATSSAHAHCERPTIQQTARGRKHAVSKEPQVSSTRKQELEGVLEIWRVAESTRLQGLAARSTLVSDCAFSGYKSVGVLHRMCMEFTSKLASSSVVEA